MKSVFKKFAVAGVLMTASFSSFANVTFTCDGFVSNVRFVPNQNAYRVSLTRADGLRLDGAVIQQNQQFLVIPALQAEGENVEYRLIINHTETSDTRCRDNNEGAGNLVGLFRIG